MKSAFCFSICFLANSLQAATKALGLSLNFPFPYFFSTCSSIGKPWQSQPGVKGVWYPDIILDLMMKSFKILFTA